MKIGWGLASRDEPESHALLHRNDVSMLRTVRSACDKNRDLCNRGITTSPVTS